MEFLLFVAANGWPKEMTCPILIRWHAFLCLFWVIRVCGRNKKIRSMQVTDCLLPRIFQTFLLAYWGSFNQSSFNHFLTKQCAGKACRVLGQMAWMAHMIPQVCMYSNMTRAKLWTNFLSFFSPSNFDQTQCNGRINLAVPLQNSSTNNMCYFY